MKLKKKKKYNLININVLNTRVYLGLKKLSIFYLNSRYIQGFRNKFCIFELIQINIFLKKSLKIIYKNHISGKKILFIGFPINKFINYKFLFTQMGHYFIPQSSSKNNLLFNKNRINYCFKTYFMLINFLKQGITPDLIVLYNQQEEIFVFKEIIKLQIPTILFFNTSDVSNQTIYKIPGNFQNSRSKTFIYLLLKCILTLSKI